MYKEKIVQLQVLIDQIRAYRSKELEDLICLEQIQEIISMPFFRKYPHTHLSEEEKKAVTCYLETAIGVCRKVINGLERK